MITTTHSNRVSPEVLRRRRATVARAAPRAGDRRGRIQRSGVDGSSVRRRCRHGGRGVRRRPGPRTPSPERSTEPSAPARVPGRPRPPGARRQPRSPTSPDVAVAAGRRPTIARRPLSDLPPLRGRREYPDAGALPGVSGRRLQGGGFAPRRGGQRGPSSPGVSVLPGPVHDVRAGRGRPARRASRATAVRCRSNGPRWRRAWRRRPRVAISGATASRAWPSGSRSAFGVPDRSSPVRRSDWPCSTNSARSTRWPTSGSPASTSTSTPRPTFIARSSCSRKSATVSRQRSTGRTQRPKRNEPDRAS